MVAKINASDLILDYKIKQTFDSCDDSYYHIYTLVCRANRDEWSTTPEVDVAVVSGIGETIWEYNECLKTVQIYQAIRYPQINQMKKDLRSEISKFRKTIAQMHPKTDKSK